MRWSDRDSVTGSGRKHVTHQSWVTGRLRHDSLYGLSRHWRSASGCRQTLYDIECAYVWRPSNGSGAVELSAGRYPYSCLSESPVPVLAGIRRVLGAVACEPVTPRWCRLQSSCRGLTGTSYRPQRGSAASLDSGPPLSCLEMVEGGGRE